MREFWPYDSVEEFQQYEKPLHSMFGFKHLKAAEDQSDVTVYCNLLVDYLSALEHQASAHCAFPAMLIMHNPALVQRFHGSAPPDV